MEATHGLRSVMTFASQSVVVYAAQALNCVQVGSALVLLQDPQTVCALVLGRDLLCHSLMILRVGVLYCGTQRRRCYRSCSVNALLRVRCHTDDRCSETAAE